MTLILGVEEGRQSLAIAQVELGPGLDQYTTNLQMALETGHVQGGALVLFLAPIGVRFALQERLQQGLQANRARLASLLPPALQTQTDAQFAAGQVQAWRGSRCTSPDRLPAVGQIAPGLHLCAAMGSRGLSFAALCAQALTQTIAPIAPKAATPADPSALPDELRHAIRAERLIIRA